MLRFQIKSSFTIWATREAHSWLWQVILSVQFSSSVGSNQPHGLQHGRLPVHQQLLDRVGDAIQPSHPMSSPSPPAFNLAQHQGFSSESTLCIRWPKFWSFSFSISTSKEHSGLISFKMDWLDLLAVQRTLKSILQHYSLKASILWCPAFFMAQLLHLHGY